MELSGTSAGFGLGLQAKAPDYANIYLAKDAERQRQAAEKKKAAEKDDEAYRNILKEIKTDGYHRLDEPIAKEKLASFINDAAKERQLNPNNWINNVSEQAQKTMFDLAQLKEHAKSLYSVEKAIEGQKANGLNTQAEDEYYKQLRSGTYADLAKLPADPTGTIGFDPESNSVFHLPLPNIDTSKIEDTYLKNPQLMSALSTVRDKSYKDQKGGSRYFNTEYIPKNAAEAQQVQQQFGLPSAPPSIESLAGTLASDPSYNRRKIYEFQASGALPKDIYSKPPQEQKELYRQALVSDLEKKSGSKRTYQISEPFAPTAEEKKPKPDYSAGLDTRQSFNAINNSGDHRGSVESDGTVSIPPVNQTLTQTTDWVNGSSFLNEHNSGITKNVSLGQIHYFPTKKGSKGIILNTDLNSLIKSGKQDEVEYKPFVAASSVEKTLKKDANGNETETPATKSYFVPFNEVKDVLKNGKDKIDVDAIENAGAEKTQQFRSSKQTQPTKKDWSKYKR